MPRFSTTRVVTAPACWRARNCSVLRQARMSQSECAASADSAPRSALTPSRAQMCCSRDTRRSLVGACRRAHSMGACGNVAFPFRRLTLCKGEATNEDCLCIRVEQ
eukprot:352421-Chlamydomonas_euryale.AAC.33